MRLVRMLLAAAVVIVAGVAIPRQPWTVQRCNIEKRAAEGFVENSESIVSDFDRRQGALRAAERMERCIAVTPNDWQVYFLAGALNDVAGRPEIAMARYRAAMALAERPDIYQAMSFIQLAHGEGAEGLRNAEKAATFNIEFTRGYAPELQSQLLAKVLARRERLRGEGK
jgi:tetratricopeptide (TPR) repeat protein